MSMVRLTGLQEMIDGISRERNLPKTAVEAALREALLKGYERYRRTQSLDVRNIFDETYFDNFDVELDRKKRASGFWPPRALWKKWPTQTTKSPSAMCKKWPPKRNWATR
jgi:hypothetical protein